MTIPVPINLAATPGTDSILWTWEKGFVPDPNFIISVKTDNTGTSADDQIMLPIRGTNMVIDWGDESSETVTQANLPNNTLAGGNNVVHTYAEVGTYEIKISNAITQIRFNSSGDRLKALNISNWGSAAWSTFTEAFLGASNLNITALDAPNLSSVLDLHNCFYGAGTMNSSNINLWNTSPCTGFYRTLRQATSFKQDISDLNFESATNIAEFLFGSNINATGTTTNYDALLNSINSQAVANSLSFHGGNSKYSSTGETSRWQLIAVHDSASADASGTDKSTYDGQAAGYQFWHTTEEKIYIKKSATSADWTTALNLGKSWTIVDGGLA